MDGIRTGYDKIAATAINGTMGPYGVGIRGGRKANDGTSVYCIIASSALGEVSVDDGVGRVVLAGNASSDHQHGPHNKHASLAQNQLQVREEVRRPLPPVVPCLGMTTAHCHSAITLQLKVKGDQFV